MVYLKRPHLHYPLMRVDQVLRETAERCDKPAFLHPIKLTYEELDARVDGFAFKLRELGMGVGDRIAICATNSIEWVVAYFGIIRAGCAVVPLSPLFKEYELEFHLKDSGAKGIVVDENLFRMLENLEMEIECITVNELRKEANLPENPAPDPEVDPKEDVAVIPYTAGTTGTPKGVMLTHFNAVSNALQFVVASEIHENDVSLITLPLYHSYAMHMLMLGGVWTGVSFVLMERFEVEKFCDLVERYGVSVIGTTAAMVIYLADFLEKTERRYDWSSWRLAIIGAAPVPEDVMNRIRPILKEKCNNDSLVFQHGWGMTEASPCVALNPFYANKPETQGIALSDVEAKVIDTDGKELALGELGEIVLRGPNIMKGYLNHPDEGFIEINGQRWLRTGDLGYIDENGYHHLVDRIKEVIKYKGHTVAPAEVEALLLKHPAVLDAAVIGKPDEVAGEIPKAFVALKEGYRGRISEDELVEWMRGRIAEYKRVREVEFVESIPRSPAGKILRRILRERETGR
jgi:acyl-CoA synthetase (AMP-forming)/AMP-acid ligase II